MVVTYGLELLTGELQAASVESKTESRTSHFSTVIFKQ